MKRATLLVATLVVTAALGPVGAASAESTVDAAAVDASAGSTDSVGVMQGTCSFPFSKTDATGTEVTVEEEPQRIVTLSPSAAQTMWEIGGKSKVVGVTKYALFLEGADKKANVSGSGMYPVNEKVVAQNPDLVLAPNPIPDQQVQKLRDAGLTVYKFREAKSIEDVYSKTTLTGKLAGQCSGASETVSWMKDRVNTVEQAVSGEDRPKVLYAMSGGFTAGNETFVNRIIETAGGTNVGAEAGITGYKQISGEVVVQQNPQWMILADGSSIPNAYSGTAAAKQNQTVTLNSNYVSQPAPRIVYPITKLAKTLHPEAYQQANATTTATQATDAGVETETTTGQESGSTTTTTTASGESSGGSVPGFGVTGALVALAAVALLMRRE